MHEDPRCLPPPCPLLPLPNCPRPQALFRPVCMMIPDYTLVAEVMLFSEGFNDAKSLSKKMVQLYKLASEQLSQQVRRLGRGQDRDTWYCMSSAEEC